MFHNYDIVSEPIVVLDQTLRVIELNQAAEQFWERSKAVLYHRPLEEMLGPNQELLRLCRRVIDNGDPIKGFDVQVDRRFLGAAVCDVSVSLTEGQGDVLVFLFRRANNLQATEAQAGSRATEGVHHLVNMLAHEIKNPLSGIKGAGQLLAMSARGNDRELAELVIEESDRLATLVDQFDFFSNSIETPKSFINIHEVLSRSEDIAINSFGKHVRFEKTYDTSLPEIFGDRDRLVQVMLNLVKNACEALEGQESPLISLHTKYQRNRMMILDNAEVLRTPLQIIIKDNGPGIPDTIQKNVFEPFRSGKTGSMGLGLSIVSKILEDHQAAIEFQSRPGQTEFCVSFPMITDPQLGGERQKT